MPAKEDNSNRTFSFDVVACLLAALSQSGVTVGAQHYKVMSKIDTSRTQHGYEHAFRPVKARAKEISDQIEKGDFGELSAAPTKAPAKKGKKAGVEVNGEKTGAKRGRKAKSEVDQDGDGEEGATAKKVKKELSEEGSDLDA